MKPAFSPEQFSFRLRHDELVRVRVFAADGFYPEIHLAASDGFFHADEEAALLVTKGCSWCRYFEDSSFDEFGWPFPAETRFMGSMILCEKHDEPCVGFYPHHEPTFLLDPHTVDLTDRTSREAIVELIKDVSAWPVATRARAYYKRRARRPLDLFGPDALDIGRFESTLQRVAPTDFVLLRGINAIIKSDMLSRHREFGAEALMNLYVALECSFQLVLAALKTAGIAAPTASDAARWMHDVFHSPFCFESPDPSYKYFQEFYESRIAAFHPRNRFGDFPFAPTFYGDVLHLRRAVPPVFAYLLHGTHSDSFTAAIKERRAAGAA